ncbi:MAG: ScaI family restriction endonuclease [Gammaproteobacteria bacterium]|nr:ScaI family restriction endonuclease [Gammaproteobacteria bacterium]
MNQISPYKDSPPTRWYQITQSLIEEHPLTEAELVEIVLSAWKSIFASKFGSSEFRIGVDIFPKPQIMGFLLHELVPLELETRYKGIWKKEATKTDKDCMHLTMPKYSFEIKTSSHPTRVFGNRSYAQKSSGSRKSKDGYFLTVNFEKFDQSNRTPRINLIRFGWLDATDWRGQKAATGQQSNLAPETYKYKLKLLYTKLLS